MTVLAGAAAWPLAARAQQPERVRRIGVLMNIAVDDAQAQSRMEAFLHGLQPLGWTVKDGIMGNTPAANNLVSEKKFWNFDLHAEFRVSAETNSGIGLRGRYEVQILDDYGKPPNTHGNGALYSRILPSENASRPSGEWQTLDVRLVGRQVSITLNGKKIIEKKEIDGLTAMANNPDEGEPGPITLQGDHRAVEFRSLVVTPLLK